MHLVDVLLLILHPVSVQDFFVSWVSIRCFLLRKLPQSPFDQVTEIFHMNANNMHFVCHEYFELVFKKLHLSSESLKSLLEIWVQNKAETRFNYIPEALMHPRKLKGVEEWHQLDCPNPSKLCYTHYPTFSTLLNCSCGFGMVMVANSSCLVLAFE